MGTQIILEDDVRNELIKRAIELDMAFSPINEVLRVILDIVPKRVDVNGGNYPSSKFDTTQNLLDGIRDTIFSISKDGMKLHKNRKWVASPNVVTIIVQEPRAHNLRITVYGRPEEFGELEQNLDMQPDMNGYSRFVINSESQLPLAKQVIKHSYKLKKDRGRIIVE
ncbi:hypothetical protein ACFLVC_05005 [Chloroflexota bacterium]